MCRSCRLRREPGPAGCAGRSAPMPCSRSSSRERSCPRRRGGRRPAGTARRRRRRCRLALAETVTFPETTDPAAGAVMDALGGEPSGAGVVAVTTADWADSFPAASLARIGVVVRGAGSPAGVLVGGIRARRDQRAVAKQLVARDAHVVAARAPREVDLGRRRHLCGQVGRHGRRGDVQRPCGGGGGLSRVVTRSVIGADPVVVGVASFRPTSWKEVVVEVPT